MNVLKNESSNCFFSKQWHRVRFHCSESSQIILLLKLILELTSLWFTVHFFVLFVLICFCKKFALLDANVRHENALTNYTGYYPHLTFLVKLYFKIGKFTYVFEFVRTKDLHLDISRKYTSWS